MNDYMMSAACMTGMLVHAFLAILFVAQMIWWVHKKICEFWDWMFSQKWIFPDSENNRKQESDTRKRE